jgi:hypothetical protein
MEQQVMQQNQKLGTQPPRLTRRAGFGSTARLEKYFGRAGTFLQLPNIGHGGDEKRPGGPGRCVFETGKRRLTTPWG